MENTAPSYAPITIADIKINESYFYVGVTRNKVMFMGTPFRFLGFGDKEHGDTWGMILKGRIDGFRDPKYEGEHVSTLGLLVGTEHPMRFGDNHWRTFRYSPEAYEFFRKIVAEQDYARYTAIAGERKRLTAAQQMQHVLLDAQFAALKEMLL